MKGREMEEVKEFEINFALSVTKCLIRTSLVLTSVLLFSPPLAALNPVAIISSSSGFHQNRPGGNRGLFLLNRQHKLKEKTTHKTLSIKRNQLTQRKCRLWENKKVIPQIPSLPSLRQAPPLNLVSFVNLKNTRLPKMVTLVIKPVRKTQFLYLSKLPLQKPRDIDKD